MGSSRKVAEADPRPRLQTLQQRGVEKGEAGAPALQQQLHPLVLRWPQPRRRPPPLAAAVVLLVVAVGVAAVEAHDFDAWLCGPVRQKQRMSVAMFLHSVWAKSPVVEAFTGALQRLSRPLRSPRRAVEGL